MTNQLPNPIIFKETIGFKLLLASGLIFMGALGVENNIYPLSFMPLFIISAAILILKSNSYIKIDREFIELKGLMFILRRRQLPISKIKLIDTVTHRGITNYRIWFDPSVIRGKFWDGTDNLLFINAVIIKKHKELLNQIMSLNKNIEVSPSVYERLLVEQNRKFNIPNMVFCFVSTCMVAGSVFIIITNK